MPPAERDRVRSGGRDGPLRDEEVERLLLRMPGASARPSFRAACRERFLAAAVEEGASHGVGVDRRSRGVDDVIERTLRNDPRRPLAREAFREECRRRFMASTAAPEAVDRSAPTPRRRLVQLVAVVTAVAAALFVTFVLPDRPRWRVVEVGGEGPLHVSRRALDPKKRDVLARELVPGAHLDSRRTTVDLALDDWLEVHVREGTELDVGRLAEFEQDGVLRLALARGELFLSTRPDATPPGTLVLIETGDGVVEVTGTVLGVAVVESGTCVCVARGSVLVHEADGGPSGPGERVEERSTFLFSGRGAMPSKRIAFGSVDDVQHDLHTSRLTDYAEVH